jgi:bacterioferritin
MPQKRIFATSIDFQIEMDCSSSWMSFCTTHLLKLKLNTPLWRLVMAKASTARPVFNKAELKKHAIQSMDKGAVTENYPLDVKQACQLLNEALAGEILCVLRYRHHQITAKGIDFIEVANEFREHAEEEEKHMLMLAERIDQLGGDPDFRPESVVKNAATEYGNAKDLREMIRDDLIAERIIIEVYRKLITWFEPDVTTRRMLEQILGDEEEHATDMSDLLARMGRH